MTQPDFISTALSLTSVLAGLFAAWAAYQSAKSARKAQSSADETVRHNALVSCGRAAAETQADFYRIQSSAARLSSECKNLACLSGFTNTADSDQALQRIAMLLQEAELHTKDTAALLITPCRLLAINSNNLTLTQITLNAKKSRLATLHAELERNLFKTEGQIAAYRKQ